MSDNPEFVGFPKIARLNRQCVITEKIDGTNGIVHVSIGGTVTAGSRHRWLVAGGVDNFGFAAWVAAHADELRTLGPGYHYGEWWGAGIQRRYRLTEKRWSLFNVTRWCTPGTEPAVISPGKLQEALPACAGLVPVIYRGPFNTDAVNAALDHLRVHGSFAAPGFPNPEGIVVHHLAAGVNFKVTLDNDGTPKGAKLDN